MGAGCSNSSSQDPTLPTSITEHEISFNASPSLSQGVEGEPTSQAGVERPGTEQQEGGSQVPSALQSPKWEMLQAWTGWKEMDQFGWTQPPLSSIVSSNGRCMLAGLPRPHDYQVAISFPGADFDKGCEGHCSDLHDHEGALLASSGTEFAEALACWLRDDWLDGSEQQALKHIFVCSQNLKYCPGSIKAVNFRHYAQGSDGTDRNTAVLNENWGMYLREAFLEAKIIIFVINEDWMDSIPCNQEFEAMLTRKSNMARSQVESGNREEERSTVIFVDITDDRFNQRWGAKLPQLKEGLAYEASKHFHVVQLTYNKQSSAEEKAHAKSELLALVRDRATRYPQDSSLHYEDVMHLAKQVDWPNWLYFKALEGSNGWETLVSISGVDKNRFDDPSPEFFPVQKSFKSRRFRIRVMGVTGDTFNEGYKYMCRPLSLLSASSGENIVREGKGYWKTCGEVMGNLGFSHWVGPKQYSWFEWLIPDSEQAEMLSQVDVRVNARSMVVEAMPEEVWPEHGDRLEGYTFHGFVAEDAQAANVHGSCADKEFKWVKLHAVDEATSGAASVSFNLSEDAPKCKSFRLRCLGMQSGERTKPIMSASLTINAFFPEGLYPLGGGTVSGSGGNAAEEDAPPSQAFDGNVQTRWVDIDGGGIGNVATLVYEHTEAVVVEEYTITTQIYALSSYHSHLNGSPRDWTLKAGTAGKHPDLWEVVDVQTGIIFSNHGETKRFKVSKPLLAQTYMLEFTGVAAGCASRSIQVGGVELFARQAACTKPLQEHQLVILSSAFHSIEDAGKAPIGSFTIPEYGLSWPTPSRLVFDIPCNPEFGPEPCMKLGAVQGGRLAWVVGEGRVSNWYDHPLDVDVRPRVNLDDPDRLIEYQAMLVVRPHKEPQLIDYITKSSFRRSYPDGECEIVYTHTAPFTLKAYSLRSADNYSRGDPSCWRLEAQTGPEEWVIVHRVSNFNFRDRGAQAMFYKLDNTASSTCYRLVITEMNAMIGLLHFKDLVFYKEVDDHSSVLIEAAPSEGASMEDLVPAEGTTDQPDNLASHTSQDVIIDRKEAAHITLKLKPREADGGQVKAVSYRLGLIDNSLARFPSAWVLEGYTTQY